MQNKFKRMLSVLFAVVMLFSSVPMTQTAETEIANPLAITAEAASKKTHLKKTKLTLTVGETYKQKLLDKKNKTIDASKVTWKSKNKKVAKVSSSGKVTAVKAGKTTITAKYKGKTYSFTVTVKNAKLKYSSKTLTKGSSFTQKLINASGDNISSSKISWSTSNKKVATVSKKGTVKAVNNGTATITAKYMGKKYNFTVKVQSPSVKLSKTSLTLEKGQTNTLKVTVVPAGSTVKWSSSNSSVATVTSSGKVTAVGTGKATITASITVGGKNYKSTCAVNVTVKEKIYGIGETWVVDGKFEFSITNVQLHEFCNSYYDTTGYKESVIITYDYKNTGYDYYSSGLKISTYDFDVYDSDGVVSKNYYCTHCTGPDYCQIGTKCIGAQEAYMLKTVGDYVYVYVNVNGDKAKFKVNIDKTEEQPETVAVDSLENIAAYACAITESQLKNPSSFVVNNIYYCKDAYIYDWDTSESRHTDVVYVWYSATNSYGGRVDGYTKAWYSTEMEPGLMSSAPYYNAHQTVGYVVVELDSSRPSTYDGTVDIDKVEKVYSGIGTYEYTKKWLYNA